MKMVNPWDKTLEHLQTR